MLYSYGGFGRLVMGNDDVQDNLIRLRQELDTADAVIIGAGSGLSTAAGYIYTGEPFERYFGDFGAKYGFKDMYSGGFYPYQTPEEMWAFWSRYIYINRYAPIPTDLYDRLLHLVEGKDYFVLTTNVDHCFQRAGFDKQRLFYTQGDYGLFQSSRPKRPLTYDNESIVRCMVLAQGWTIAENGRLEGPTNADGTTDFSQISMTIPSDMVPICPDDGQPMAMNLRSDDTFVEDAGWHEACERYQEYQESHDEKHVLYLELGVGMNTPVIIKYPFWQMTEHNKKAVFASINMGQAICPQTIAKRSILIDGDIGEVIRNI